MSIRFTIRSILKQPGYFFFLCLILNCHIVKAQYDTSNILYDSLEAIAQYSHSDIAENFKKKADTQENKSLQRYKTQQLKSSQEMLLNKIQISIARANAYLRKGIDTLQIAQDLSTIDAAMRLVKDGIFSNKGSIQTDRNLTISSIILTQLESKASKRKKAVDGYISDLYGIRGNLDSLATDSILYIIPEDSIALKKYMAKQLSIILLFIPVDSALNKVISNIELLQFRANIQVNELQTLIFEIEHYKETTSSNRMTAEVPVLWAPRAYARPFREIWDVSIAKNRLALRFYVDENYFWIFLILLIIGISYVFLRTLKTSIIQGKYEDDATEQVDKCISIKYPLLTAIVVVINPLQFLFVDMPFIFNAIIWLLSAVCLTIIFYKYISAYWMRFWIITQVLFIAACLSNIVLQASRPERIYMLLLALSGVIYSLSILLGGKRTELKERGIVYFIGLVTFFEGLAVLLNIFGRYNMSKTLMTSGFIGIVIGICFFWTIRLINEGLTLAAMVYKQPHVRSFYINFSKLGKRAPSYLYALLIIGWFTLVGRNFYAFNALSRPFNDFLTSDRNIGDFTFSIKGIFVFILIITCSSILSKIISYFAADQNTTGKAGNNSKSVSMGSYVLLIRIFVICIGLLLAFAATGIPLDKITIIIGALGVGIGLGLQGLVNNLVSGLILAFEKPVNVGDMIEMNGKLGTMKSIGFRSSIITMIDGANMIIPNGNLLSERLINWTMSHNIRRMSIVVGIAYGTDIEQARAIVTKAAADDEKVLKYPPPFTLAKEFNASSIDLELFFWTPNVRESLSVRSSVLARIDVVLKEANITIPFPQQDTWMRSKEE